MTLTKKLVDMQYQLREAQENGELDLFIEDFNEDLYRLLEQAARRLVLIDRA